MKFLLRVRKIETVEFRILRLQEEQDIRSYNNQMAAAIKLGPYSFRFDQFILAPRKISEFIFILE